MENVTTKFDRVILRYHKGKIPFVFVTAFIALILCVSIFSAIPSTEIAQAFGLEDKIDDDFVEFYQTKIANSPIITDMDKQVFDKMMKDYNLTEKRLVLLLVIEDFGRRAYNPKSFDELTEMSDKALLLYGKTLVKAYGDTLEQDEREELKAEFLSLLRKK